MWKFWLQLERDEKNLSMYLSPRIFKPSYNPETGLLASMLACGGTQKSLRPLAFMAFRESKQSLQKNCITQWKKTCDHYSWNLGKIKTEKTFSSDKNKLFQVFIFDDNVLQTPVTKLYCSSYDKYPISAKVSVIGLFCAKMKFFVQEKLEKLKRAILGVSRGYHIRNYCNDH